MGRIRLTILGAILLLAACSRPQSAEVPDLIVTNSILADVVSNLLVDHPALASLVPNGTDAHDYAPSAAQVAAISSADLVIANGLGLEEGLADLLEQARSEGIEVVTVAESVDPIEADPHFWHDPTRMSLAAALIGERLDANGYPTVLPEYQESLKALDQEVEELLSNIPLEQRLLVTNHDSFSYFADRYDFEVVGTLIPGTSPDSSPSSEHLASLLEVIGERGVRAIFVDDTSSLALATSLASDAGIEVVVLASETLGPPGSASGTYIGMIRSNAEAIAAALGEP